MNSRENNSKSRGRRVSKKKAALAPPLFTSKRIRFPLEMVLYVGNFMCFQDFRSFILSLYPHRAVSEVIHQKLWQLSTYETETKFINGKRMVIKYNFDPLRTREDRILMNVESLSPIFGGIVSPTMKKFAAVSELTNFVKMHIHLNQCSGGRFATCSCLLVDTHGPGFEAFEQPLTDACTYGHHHHYCSYDLARWLKALEATLMQLRQQRHGFIEDPTRSGIISTDEFVYVHGVGMQPQTSELYRLLNR